MRRLFYFFGAAGLILLLLVNGRMLLSPAPSAPVFRAAADSILPEAASNTGLMFEVAARSQESAVTIEMEREDARTAVISTPLELGPDDGTLPAAPAYPRSALTGKLARECEAQPDVERKGMLRFIGGGRCVAGRALCNALRRALAFVPSLTTQQRARPKIVVTTFVGGQERMLDSLAMSAAALGVPLIALALDAAGAQAAPTRGESAVPVSVADLSSAGALPHNSFIPGEARGDGQGTGVAAPFSNSPLVTKWRALAGLLASGAAVMYADVDAVLAADPFTVVFGDSDFEVLSEAWEEDSARG